MVSPETEHVKTPFTPPKKPVSTPIVPPKEPIKAPIAPPKEPIKIPMAPSARTMPKVEPVKPAEQVKPVEPAIPPKPVKPVKTRKKIPVLPIAIIVIVIIAGAAFWIIYNKLSQHKSGKAENHAAVSTIDPAVQTRKAAGGNLNTSVPADTTVKMNLQETAVSTSSAKILLQVGSADDPRECNPRDPPRLRLSKQTMIVRITTDHYNQGKGTDYTGTISIRDNNGKEVGRFSTHGKPGKNGAANSYWVAEPGKILPAGMYYIWDSNLPTWSKKSTGEAFILVEGYETE
jgi:hypothetical protein